MEYKLEITKVLEDIACTLDDRVAILNLPTANFCEKRAEQVLVGGRPQQACMGCITQQLKTPDRILINEVREIIDYFAESHNTRFITVNGRGDPLHPALSAETKEKIRHAYERWGIQSYVFTAGNNLNEETCTFLAQYKVNVMMSLFGNQFIDTEFFQGKEYSHEEKPLQDKAEIAANFRRLINAYKQSSTPPENGLTRLGMNYVISERDLADHGMKASALKEAANANGVFFICNTPFQKNSDTAVQQQLEELANQCSDFNLRHSTFVNGQCQMGAGSSATVDFDGTLLRCPYMESSQGDGKFIELPIAERKRILAEYLADKAYPCVMRKYRK